MMHPHTYVKEVNKDIGLGVFASEDIPLGSVTYIKDPFEIELSPHEFKQLDPTLQVIMEKYTYTEPDGSRVLSWDHGKYVNHCCFPNTLTTAYGCEIAIRDIKKGEQITDDYRLFNLEYRMSLLCHKSNCSKEINNANYDHMVVEWDYEIKNALHHFRSVPQPLLSIVASEEYADLFAYLDKVAPYRSVMTLKYLPAHSSTAKGAEKYFVAPREAECPMPS